VRPYPISVDFTELPAETPATPAYLERSGVLKALGIQSAFLGVGVDRLDYTKGILERFLAIERFLENISPISGPVYVHPDWRTSRTHIKRYHDLQAEIERRLNGSTGVFRKINGGRLSA